MIIERVTSKPESNAYTWSDHVDHLIDHRDLAPADVAISRQIGERRKRDKERRRKESKRSAGREGERSSMMS